MEQSLDLFLDDVSLLPKLLKPEEEAALIAQYKSGGPQAIAARQELIERNLRLVISNAFRYYRLGVHSISRQDLIQVGVMGLIRALEKFDPSRGLKLSTYATAWIKQAMTREISQMGSTIRIPEWQYHRIRQIKKTERNLAQVLGRDPLPGEVSQVTGISETTAERLIRVSTPVSIEYIEGERPDFDNSRSEWLIADNDTEQDAEKSVVAATVKEALGKLKNPRDERILRALFNIDGNGPENMTTVSKRFGVTRERIRQIRNAALDELRGILIEMNAAIDIPHVKVETKPISGKPDKVRLVMPKEVDKRHRDDFRGHFNRYHLRYTGKEFENCAPYTFYWDPVHFFVYGVCDDCETVYIKPNKSNVRRASDATRYRGQMSRRSMREITSGRFGCTN